MGNKYIDYSYRIGEEYKNRFGQKYKIIKYTDALNVDIEFEDGVVVKNRSYYCVKNGVIKNRFTPTVYGVGFTGIGKYKTTDTIKKDRWIRILQRCYDEKSIERYPTYRDVEVCKEWHNFQNFAQWFEENYDPETMKGWHLDKDIICSECKIYSPETCAFVPPEINGIFTNSSSFRGKYPIGVYKQKNRFLASINTYKSQKKLGSFLTYEEAFQTYKIEKEKYIKEVADKWKDQLDPRVHKAMYNYQVEITD